jgi:hypothetical protein
MFDEKIVEELQTSPEVTNTPPPAEHLEKTNTMIRDAVRQLGAGKNGMFTVLVDTTHGINGAYVQRAGDHVTIVSYLTKRWGEPVAAGVAATLDW